VDATVSRFTGFFKNAIKYVSVPVVLIEPSFGDDRPLPAPCDSASPVGLFRTGRPYGDNEAAYAASATKSSTVSFSTLAFINALSLPARAPDLKSCSWRTI
jgi:hypothetical protein